MGRYQDVSEASQKTDIDNGSIHKVLRGDRATAGGFIWKIEEHVNENISTNELKEAIHAQGLTEDEVKSVKIWQTMSGETRYSIVTKDGGKAAQKFKDEFFEKLKTISPPEKKRSYTKKDNNSIVYEISLPDIHYGKDTDDNVETAEEHFMNSVIELHERASGLNIDRFLLPIGNDGMNSEGFSRATTKGTPQQDSAAWQETFVGYCNLMVRAVCFLARTAPVDLVVIQGNHDYERMFYAGEFLRAFFLNDERVNVDNGYDSRKYYEYGINMIMFTHGDKEKPAQMPLIMATEQPEMFARTKHREVHCGHLHKEMINEYRGIKVRFIPSICGNDEWHKMMGYEAKRTGQAHIWNKQRGYEGYLQTNV